jgi:DNA-binding transcriptional regulator YdaS (Cro superfamily)
MNNSVNPVDHAINRAGGIRPLARALGIAPSGICAWRRRGRIPPARVVRVAQITGLARELLAPELFGVIE